MSNLYNRIELLCQQNNINITELCRQAEVPRGNLTDLKKERQSGLSAKNLTRIAAVLEAPVNFFLGIGPFEHWDKINENRAQFFHCVDFDPELLSLAYGIDFGKLEDEKVKPIIDFLAEQVENARPLENGAWEVKMKNGYNAKKAPALTEKDERDIARDLERIMAQLDAGGDLMFDGDPMSDEARESIKAAMKLGLEAAKVKNKERFTPKQYRKE